MNHRRKNDASELQRLGDLVGAVLKRCKPPSGKGIEALRLAWAECVAPQYAGHCRIASFSRGKLRVEVASPAVLSEMEGFLRQDILACLKQKRPDINVVELQFVQRG